MGLCASPRLGEARVAQRASTTSMPAAILVWLGVWCFWPMQVRKPETTFAAQTALPGDGALYVRHFIVYPERSTQLCYSTRTVLVLHIVHEERGSLISASTRPAQRSSMRHRRSASSGAEETAFMPALHAHNVLEQTPLHVSPFWPVPW